MNGRLYIIEGIDGSGKSTQVELLKTRLEKEYPVMQVKFPNYADLSSSLVKMYLQGEFGSSPNSVNAYAASTFYAVDRYASFNKFWKKDYLAGTCIISDRYVSSNIIHQSGKLPPEKRIEFIEWLYDLEYEKLKIPKPDEVFFLDMPPEFSLKQVEKRYNGDENKKDIHERDFDYMKQCYDISLFACEYLNFKRIKCIKNGVLRDKQDIADEIYGLIKKH